MVCRTEKHCDRSQLCRGTNVPKEFYPGYLSFLFLMATSKYSWSVKFKFKLDSELYPLFCIF